MGAYLYPQRHAKLFFYSVILPFYIYYELMFTYKCCELNKKTTTQTTKTKYDEQF